jgi:hypothetical protein
MEILMKIQLKSMSLKIGKKITGQLGIKQALQIGEPILVGAILISMKASAPSQLPTSAGILVLISLEMCSIVLTSGQKEN